MNRINPLYIGALLIMVLLLSIYSLNSAKKSLLESKENFKETQKIANELSGLKKAYANKKVNERSIKKILSQTLLKSAQIEAKYKKSGVVITSSGVDKKVLDFFIAKVLNSTYDIRKLKIKRLSEQKATLELEIRWWCYLAVLDLRDSLNL